MANPKASWGIEIGAYAIKAIRLERNGDDVSVSDFAVIPHKKVLTTPDLDQDEMVRLGLGQFISQKTLEGEHLVMSVPGHAAFARFAKLPPVEPKKVPDIVKFEAVQQIPFPIDEVEWDYQTFTSPDTPEIEVGIFAITRERVQQRLGLYSELGMTPESLTLSPVAVYNAMNYDLAGGKGPVVYIDIGTSATDVIVAEAGRCWIRTFPLGGTHFTEAIAQAFKLSYSKAEKLKLEASDSKYAKQIMQAMRPVFSDLLQDLQRSIGYYQSLHRESQLTTMVGIGSTFKIPGLRKFLGQQLQIDVVRLDEYKKIQVTGREAASFAENAVNMATAYGLALQGVGLAQINANLVPVKALRDQMWQSKTKWFAAAAAIMIAGSAMLLYRPIADKASMEPVMNPDVTRVINRGRELKQQLETLKASSDVGATAANMTGLLEQREIWPFVLNDVATALAAAKPQPELTQGDVEAILKLDPAKRNLVQLNGLKSAYQPPAAQGQPRSITITMNVEFSHDDPTRFINDTVIAWLDAHKDPSGDRASVPYKIADINWSPTNIEEITVEESGKETVKESRSGGGGEPSEPRGNSSPAAPPRNIGSFGSAASGGSGGGLRAGGGPTQAAPGAGLGPAAAGAAGGGGIRPGNNVPEASPAAPDPGNYGGSADPNGKAGGDVDKMAPVPDRPNLYPPKSKYYRLPITFTVQLIDKNPAPAADPAAATDGAAQ